MQAERVFPIMGTTAQVLVVGQRAETLVEYGTSRLGELERKWSRFLPTSEISRANELAGSHVVVSPETLLLVGCSVAGWAHTGGAFDPTVLAAVRAAGYDRDFGSVAEAAASLRPAAPRCPPGCAGIVRDERIGTITLPPGVELDPGGIGKGLAADLVTAELMEKGALGALVNVGGDVRVRGDAPNGASWDVAVEDPARPGVELLRIGLLDGAIATSSRAKRCWETAAGAAHHIIDPRTGRPSSSRYISVTAVARDAWWAEVVTKAVMIDELGIDAGARYGARVVIVNEGGTVTFDPELVGIAA
jgi:thiamine biosynthesis lipoprotein